MKRTPVKSSSVVSVGYHPATCELEIEFRTGRTYRYRGVPAAVHRLLLQAPSIGRYVNREVKPRFEAEEV